jgi:hypothetical protein
MCSHVVCYCSDACLVSIAKSKYYYVCYIVCIQVMEGLLQFLDDTYGSVDSYLDSIGFDEQWRQQLRAACSEDTAAAVGSDAPHTSTLQQAPVA